MPDVDTSTSTLTFLFTDIEASTRLLAELGDEYDALLLTHDGIIRAAAADAGGEPFGSEGDAQYIAFVDAAAAVRAAVAAQRALSAQTWPGARPVRVRMGIHTGSVRRQGDQYVGMALHETARIAAAGHGGQVLLSPATASLVRGQLPDNVSLLDLGEQRLKDIDEPMRIRQVSIEGLSSEFPPLRVLGPVRARLPTQMTSFVGRQEVEAVVDLAQATRLVTLTGPGGTGKTRLSIEAAEQLAPVFRDGVFFVALDAVNASDLVASEIAAAVGLAAGSGPPLERVISHLADRSALLVLDNMEQVLDARESVAALLRECPDVSVIATSRIPLRIYGEHEFPVPALSVPPRSAVQDAGTVADYEAVRLFTERATAARPDFVLDERTLGPVVDIVSRLDGLPLAIELAAARLRILPIDALYRRLDDSLATLTGGARDLPDRQRTLRGAIAWSYDLLDDSDRRFFARFSVFAGGAEIEQIEALSDPEEESEHDVFESLESLTEQSLIRALVGGTEPRFSMLSTIREFGDECLETAGEANTIRLRHAQAYLRLVEEAQPHLIGPDGATWNDRLEAEHDNLRVALDWLIEQDEGELALRYISAMWRFFQVRGHLHEGGDVVHRVLDMPSAAQQPAALQARAEAAAGGIAYWRSRIAELNEHYSRALAHARESGDDSLLAEALYNMGFAPDKNLLSQVDRYRIGRPYFDEALELYRASGDRAGEASALWALSQSAMAAKDTEVADQLGFESLLIARELGDPFRLGWAAFTLGLDRLSRDDSDSVAELLSEALEVFVASEDVGGLTLNLSAVAMFAYKRGDLDASWRLMGASTKMRDETGTNLVDEDVSFGNWDPGRRPDTPEGQQAFKDGRGLSMDDAIALGRETLSNA